MTKPPPMNPYKEQLIASIREKFTDETFEILPDEKYNLDFKRKEIASLQSILTHIEAFEAREEEKKDYYTKCPKCEGYGYTSEHNDLSRNYETGEHDCSECPIQVQCDNCKATGFVSASTPELPSVDEIEIILQEGWQQSPDRYYSVKTIELQATAIRKYLEDRR